MKIWVRDLAARIRASNMLILCKDRQQWKRRMSQVDRNMLADIVEHGLDAGSEPNLRGLLMSAKRYVSAFHENPDNHPQARDAALDLAHQITLALEGQS